MPTNHANGPIKQALKEPSELFLLSQVTSFFYLQFVNFDPKFCESLEKAFLDLRYGAGIQVLKTGVSCAMSFLAKIRLRLNQKGCVYNIVHGYSQLLLVSCRKAILLSSLR